MGQIGVREHQAELGVLLVLFVGRSGEVGQVGRAEVLVADLI